jgi:hypothetical protein
MGKYHIRCPAQVPCNPAGYCHSCGNLPGVGQKALPSETQGYSGVYNNMIQPRIDSTAHPPDSKGFSSQNFYLHGLALSKFFF